MRAAVGPPGKKSHDFAWIYELDAGVHGVWVSKTKECMYVWKVTGVRCVITCIRGKIILDVFQVNRFIPLLLIHYPTMYKHKA
jgi:hypothetical protein